MAGLLAIFAQFEREILRERVKAGIAQARRHGKRIVSKIRGEMKDTSEEASYSI
jgi:DNA invertase Pin-like site-specific DNA recombinase